MARPLRVLILADHWGELGGGEVVAAQLAEGLRGRFELAVLTTDCRRNTKERRDHLTVYRVRSEYHLRLRPLLGLANPLALGGVRRALADFKPDLVHGWNVHQHLSFASLELAKRAGAATVLTFQDGFPFCYTKYHCYIDRAAPCPARPAYRARPERCRSCSRHYWLFPPRNRIARFLLNHYVDQKVSVSHALADALADNGLPGARVIHNGLPLDDFPPPPERVAALQGRFGLGPETIVAGGRMGYFKGQLRLLEAFARIARDRPNTRVALAGRHDDWFGAALKRRAAELQLADRVLFTGFLPRSEFLALLSAGAIFANLSLYLDPFPTVNLEAGAAERPVLGTCYGGTPEVVLDGQTGRLVNPYQLDEVVGALHALLDDPAERTRLGRAAGARVRAEFPQCRMVEAYATLFNSLV